MRVLLLEDIKNLGRRGEVKEAASGFARNFLLPKGLAIFATSQVEVEWKTKMEKERQEVETDLKRVQELASKLDGYELEIAVKAGAEGKLYGGFGAQKIAEELKKKNFVVSKTQIAIPKPIKTVGEHRVIVKFPHGLEAEVAVIVKEDTRNKIQINFKVKS